MRGSPGYTSLPDNVAVNRDNASSTIVVGLPKSTYSIALPVASAFFIPVIS